MSGSTIALWITISDPYIRPDGKLVIEFNVMGTKFEREIDGTKYTHNGKDWRLINPDGNIKNT